MGAERRSAIVLEVFEASPTGVQGRFRTRNRVASFQTAEKRRTHRDQAEAYKEHTADAKDKGDAVNFQ
jgi:hypothetical protein